MTKMTGDNIIKPKNAKIRSKIYLNTINNLQLYTFKLLYTLNSKL